MQRQSLCEGESMDIYRVLCGILGADIFGERTVALDERECLDLADGSRLIKVRGGCGCGANTMRYVLRRSF